MRSNLVNIAKFRSQLSTYLYKVRQGAEVIIADRETPIGRLIPISSEHEQQSWEMIPALKNSRGLAKLKFSPLKHDFDSVEMLLEDRRRR